MKSFLSILTLGIVTAAFIAGFFYGKLKPAVQTPQQLTLEQILSIKELHLVKHTYNDLFFLHKHNNPAKAIRAIVQVPVVVTSYLDLKEVQIIRQHDSVVQIILPRARLNKPQYQVENMIVRETKALQIHVGKDQYAQIGQYVQQLIAVRTDSVGRMAVANRILAQAEVEGKEYVMSLLRELGHPEIRVTMVDEAFVPEAVTVRTPRVLAAKVDFIPFGFIPIK